MAQITLYDLIRDNKSLSESDIDQLVDLLGHRCRHEKKARLRSVLTYLSGQKLHGIFDRVMLEGDRWVYVAGQDYPSEIRTVRELLCS